jgi:mannose-6-phosphate isomerase-like protein (cupin superfamily)
VSFEIFGADSQAKVPPFPGAVGITGLDVYQPAGADGIHGGAPHVHLCCSECYVVVEGTGRLQTLSAAGYREVPLAPNDVVWFTPGTIHRSVNDGGLRVVAVMQNSGLPEAGDAVMTFPPEIVGDATRYAAAASLAGDDATIDDRMARRRDLAIVGFTALRDSVEAGDFSVVEDFYRSAAELVRPLLSEWRSRIESVVLDDVERTLARIEALVSGNNSHLDHAVVSRISPDAERLWGMCGRLRAYDPIRERASVAGP